MPTVLHATAVARHAAHQLRLYPRGAQLAALSDTLERALPQAIPQSALARALGVTPKTIWRWSAAGLVPLEQAAPGARPGVPKAFAVEAVVESERLLHLPRRRRVRHVGDALRNVGGRPTR